VVRPNDTKGPAALRTRDRGAPRGVLPVAAAQVRQDEQVTAPDLIPTSDALALAESEVVDLCSELIRIDSVNAGDGSGPGEREAAEYVAEKLAEFGLDVSLHESGPRRTSLVARIEGTDSNRGALLVHGHLDVVPAFAEDWQVDPFAGEVRDGCVWGRGAVDMKDMDAMILASVRGMLRSGRKPKRDIVLCFLADEEAGGTMGSHWLAENHADLFDGCTEAIGEVGGFSLTVADQRFYLVETAEKGIGWLRLTARGRAGHGSMDNDSNAVTILAEAVARIGNHEWPLRVRGPVRSLLEESADRLGIEVDVEDPASVARVIDRLGALGTMIGATVRNTANPTMLDAGYKVNVIPGEAVAHIDGRFLPGLEEEFLQTIDELMGPHVTREYDHRDIAVETTFDGPITDVMVSSLLAEDPDARVVPYMLSGGTDAKAFSQLGIRCFGYAPLRLPPDLNFAGMFHGVDERVPVDALQFGVRVLDRFLNEA
jgi:acetylornithine deacetylase/succinyl-diaminopimelate desuccinylase-like protein